MPTPHLTSDTGSPSVSAPHPHYEEIFKPPQPSSWQVQTEPQNPSEHQPPFTYQGQERRGPSARPRPHPSLTPKGQILTLDSMKDATVQRFAAGVVGGRADAGATAVSQRVPEMGGREGGKSGPLWWGQGAAPSPPSGLCEGLTGQRRRPGGAAAGPCAVCPR